MGPGKRAKTYRVFGGHLPGKTNLKFFGYVTDGDGVFEKEPGGLYKWIEKKFSCSNWLCDAFGNQDLDDEEELKKIFQTEMQKKYAALPCFTVKLWQAEDLKELVTLLEAKAKESSGEISSEKLQQTMAEHVSEIVTESPDMYSDSPIVMWNLGNVLEKITKTEKSKVSTKNDKNTKAEKNTKADKITKADSKGAKATDSEVKSVPCSKCPELSLKIELLENENLDNANKLEKLEKEKDAANRENVVKVDNLEKEKDSANRENVIKINQLEKDKDAANRANVIKIDQLEKEKDAINRENVDMADKVDSLTSEVKKLMAENEDLKKGRAGDGETERDMFMSQEQSMRLNLSATAQPYATREDVRVILNEVLSTKLNDVHDSQEKILTGVDDLKTKSEKQDVSAYETARSLREVQGQLEKYLHRPSLETIMKKLKIVGEDVKNVQKSEIELAVRVKDVNEEVRKIQKAKVGLTAQNETSAQVEEGGEPVQLMFEKMPDSEDIVLAGDRNLDFMKQRMADVIFDLLPKAKFVTNKESKCGMFVTLECYGPMLKEVNGSTRVLVISVGKDDLLQDPAVLTEASSQWVDKEKRNASNQKIIENVTERINMILLKVTEDFPDLKVIYIAPPPSVRESDLFIQFRSHLKKQEIFRKVIYLDILDILAGKGDWEDTDEASDPGCLNYKASRLLMNMTYNEIFPSKNQTFCTTCGGVHLDYCPGPDSVQGEPTKMKMDKELCWFCYKIGHRSATCAIKEGLRKRGVGCPHCGLNADKLVHHPDVCQARFILCNVCNQFGHKTEAHQNPVALKKVHDRIGYNLIVKTIVDPGGSSEERASKRRKPNKSDENSNRTGS